MSVCRLGAVGKQGGPRQDPDRCTFIVCTYVAEGLGSTEIDVPTALSMRQRYKNRGRYRGTGTEVNTL